MKEIKQLLYGKVSKEKIELFSREIELLNERFELKESEKIENNILINWNAGINKNRIEINGLDKKIENEVISLFNQIYK
ncbi:MAG: hypothetical protein HKP48_07895 [Winogradskyella sp.]|uniref:hypothetical protein n=1 Tax=Winogradskyella sp. TaxID=1883156 RepID=UPI0017BD5608|nr:hypothetical protein [Winogradskyella sp.]MBT8243920.1 hypothetical protein [Winogradskyella sp.]NNK23203.1 hypothetical protein [Winogradskyella sp.]